MKNIMEYRVKNNMKNIIPSMVILLVSLSIIDAYLTVIILSNGGTEENPVMKFLIDHAGYYGFFTIKTFVVTTLAFILMMISDLYPKYFRFIKTSLSAMICIYISVVVWEIYLITLIFS